MIVIDGTLAISEQQEASAARLLGDVAALAGAVPGLSEMRWQPMPADSATPAADPETSAPVGPAARFAAHMTVRLPMGMFRSRIAGSVRTEGQRVTATMHGDLHSLAGSFDATVELGLDESGRRLHYRLAVTLGGWLASLGEGMLRPIMAAKAKEFEGNLRRQLTGTLTGDGRSGP